MPAVFSKVKHLKQKQFWNQQVKCYHNPAGITFHPICDLNEHVLRVAWVWSTWKPSEEPFSFLVGLYTVYLGTTNYSTVQYNKIQYSTVQYSTIHIHVGACSQFTSCPSCAPPLDPPPPCQAAASPAHQLFISTVPPKSLDAILL